MEIQYYKKNVYGKLNLYVKDNEQASWIMALTRRTTITVRDIIALQKLGHTFVEVVAP